VATYKLIQDIEAEDKILGPLTLRQFVFGLLAAFLGYVCFLCIAKGVFFLLIIFAPPMIFFGFFAMPFGRDQPTEVWALAKFRYFVMPRRRVWDQSGVKELVTITAPKKVEKIYTDGLSQNEVKSRLQALANTIDSRGWAVKNVGGSGFAPNPVTAASPDRLVDLSSLPAEVPTEVQLPEEDMLDSINNPIARQFDNLMDRSDARRRQQIMDQINSAPQALKAPANPSPTANPISSTQMDDTQASSSGDYWFMSANPSAPTMTISQPVAQDLPDEDRIAAELKRNTSTHNEATEHMRTLRTNLSQPEPQAQAASPEVTTPRDPAILTLANNNDLNVATLAREANKAKTNKSGSANEVVVSLH